MKKLTGEQIEFCRKIENQFIEFHKTGDTREITKSFRNSFDEFEMSYIYSLMVESPLSASKYIKTKDLFKSIPELLFGSDIESDKNLANLYKYKYEFKTDVDLKFHGRYGSIYVLSNESMPGILKIGFTGRTVLSRTKELNNTSIPTPFNVEFFARINRPELLESNVHSALGEFRVSSNREFFKISKEDAISKILEIAPHIKRDF